MEYQYFEYSAHLIFLDCTNGSRPVPPPVQWLSKSAPGFYKTIAVADDEIECFIQYPSISLVSLCDRDKDRGDEEDDGDDDDDDALKVIQSSEECQTPTCGGAAKVNNFNQLQYVDDDHNSDVNKQYYEKTILEPMKYYLLYKYDQHKGRILLPNQMNFWKSAKGVGSFSIQKFILHILVTLNRAL